MSEQLEGIKGRLDLAKEMDFLYIGLDIKEVEYFIHKAERVEELEEEIELEKEKANQVIVEYELKNKRYRQALEEIANAPDDMSKGKHSIFADYIARRALGGDS